MGLDYIRFFEEQLEARGLNKAQASEFIKIRTGYEISAQQVYEFLDKRRESCPTTAMVKVWERAFEVNLAPRYYGSDMAFSKSPKGDRKK